MKFKKLIAMALAFAMALTLAVPAFAEAETEVTDDSAAAETTNNSYTTIPGQDNTEDEDGNIIVTTTKWNFTGDYFYMKQGTAGILWFRSEDVLKSMSNNTYDANSNGVSVAKYFHDEAAVKFVNNDPSKGGALTDGVKLWIGENTFELKHYFTADQYDHTTITVAGSVLTIAGAISHVNAAGTVTQIPDEPTTISATLNIQKLIQSGDNQVAPTYESFTFQVLDGTTVLGTVTTSKTTGLGNATVTVTPGKTYTIHEVLEGYQAGKYTATDMTVTIPADAAEGYTATVNFVNAPSGETSTVFQINKYLNDMTTVGAGFVFDIIAGDGTVVGTMTSDEYGIAATEDFFVEPGTYTIREQVPTNQEYEYEPVADVIVTVDEDGNPNYSTDAATGEEINYVLNVQKGKLNVTAPTEVFQKQSQEVHELVYQVYSEGTLVSHIASVSGAALPDGITGSYLKNGMTYLTINKAKLEAAGEDGVDIGIATSDPQKGNKTSWNTPAPAPKGEADQPTYNLKIENGKLVVTSELPNIGVRLYSAKESPKGPSDFKGSYATKGHLTGAKTASFNIPKGDTFKVFVHIEDTSYETNAVIGCKVTSTVIEEIPFVCTLTTTVTDANGVEVDATKQLSAGTYTVTVTNDKTDDVWTKTVEVKPGETTSVSFDKLVVAEMAEPIIKCPYVDNLGGPAHGIFPDYPLYEAMPIED